MLVAVIGGGAAGIVTAKCLRDEGLEILVFERQKELGGVWAHCNPEMRCNVSKQVKAQSGS